MGESEQVFPGQSGCPFQNLFAVVFGTSAGWIKGIIIFNSKDLALMFVGEGHEALWNTKH